MIDLYNNENYFELHSGIESRQYLQSNVLNPTFSIVIPTDKRNEEGGAS